MQERVPNKERRDLVYYTKVSEDEEGVWGTLWLGLGDTMICFALLCFVLFRLTRRHGTWLLDELKYVWTRLVTCIMDPCVPIPYSKVLGVLMRLFCRRDTSPKHGGKDIEVADRPAALARFAGSRLDPRCGWPRRGAGFACNTMSLYEWREVVKSWGHILGFFPLLGLVRPVPMELFGLLNNPHR